MICIKRLPKLLQLKESAPCLLPFRMYWIRENQKEIKKLKSLESVLLAGKMLTGMLF